LLFRPSMWHKAKRVVLTPGQTEVKVDFPLPIVACNLMVEYCDFYDNLQVRHTCCYSLC
jgi:E3 ubiquitin-protein ligase UBR4